MRSRRSLGLGIAMLAIASTSQPRPAGATGSDLEPLPEPVLVGVEEAVKAQLVERRRAAAEWLGSSELGAAERSDVYGSLGQLYFAYDILDAAEPCLSSARSLDPTEFSWRYLLGALYTRTGDVGRALEELEAAVALRPADVPTRLRLGRLYLDLGRLADAERLFAEVLETDQRIAAAEHGLGVIAQERGSWRASLGHLERALELQPGATSIHYLLGVARRELGELGEARRHLALNRHDPVLFQDPEVDGLNGLIEGGRYYLQLGELALGRGNTAEAIRAFREAISRAPGDALAHYNLGLSLLETGAGAEGMGHLREAVRLDPGHRDAHFNLASVEAEAGRWGEAEAHFARAVAVDPTDDEARLAWARSLIRVERAADARSALEDMLDSAPSPSRLDPRIRLALAEALEALGQPNEARGRLQEVLSGPADAAYLARAHERLARIALTTGTRVDAIRELRRALEIDPRLEGGFEQLGALLGQEAAFGEAALAYRRAVAAEPGSLTARFGLTMALLLSGETEEARRALEEGIGILGQRLPLRHLLARILATAREDELRDGRRSLAIAREVFQARPSAEHAETVAMALAETGDFEQAVEWQERALALGSSEPGVDLAVLQRRLDLYRAGRPCRSPWLPS